MNASLHRLLLSYPFLVKEISFRTYLIPWILVETHYGHLLFNVDLKVVAIKKMELPPSKEADGEREFRVEVDILSRLDHPNLVSLIGYCADRKQRFLVYEYLPNGNLQDHLNG